MSDISEPSELKTASHLARNLVSLRHSRALTQDALAKAAALPRSTIANLESGDGNPSLAVLVKVASALGVPIRFRVCSYSRARGKARLTRHRGSPIISSKRYKATRIERS
jgi:transcriptional regulator with XRE-family HTH domain